MPAHCVDRAHSDDNLIELMCQGYTKRMTNYQNIDNLYGNICGEKRY